MDSFRGRDDFQADEHEKYDRAELSEYVREKLKRISDNWNEVTTGFDAMAANGAPGRRSNGLAELLRTWGGNDGPLSTQVAGDQCQASATAVGLVAFSGPISATAPEEIRFCGCSQVCVQSSHSYTQRKTHLHRGRISIG